MWPKPRPIGSQLCWARQWCWADSGWVGGSATAGRPWARATSCWRVCCRVSWQREPRRGGGAGSPSSVGGTYDNARAESVIGLTRPNCATACSINPSGSVVLDDGVLVVRVVPPPGTVAGDSGQLAGSVGDGPGDGPGSGCVRAIARAMRLNNESVGGRSVRQLARRAQDVHAGGWQFGDWRRRQAVVSAAGGSP